MSVVTIIHSRGVACKNHRTGNCPEGYNIGSRYMFERCENDMGRYVRVYGVEMSPGETEPCTFSPPFECDDISEHKFNQLFSLVSEQGTGAALK